MHSLLGSYDSDEENAEEARDVLQSKAAAVPQNSSPAIIARKQAEKATLPHQTGTESSASGKHSSACECEDCNGLMARFVAKSLQTKGIRFKCKLCSDLVARKADAAEHFQILHAKDLQAFKQQKMPKLFQEAKKSAAAAKKISFAREDVLGKKRKIDDEVDFGGWAKKEKPEPAPCETDEYQEALQSDVFTAPPWMNMPAPLLTTEGASDTDKQIDAHVNQAQVRRFSSRNILEVNATTVRCKLCYKTLPGKIQAEKHVFETHQAEFEKETEIWHRFLLTSCKRQPPFGWVCKICNLFFPTDQATWRHLGKEVYIRREERHAGSWHEKEDRWGHQDDQECCGDGINVSHGLSYDSVKVFQEQAKLLGGGQANVGSGPNRGEQESDDDEGGDRKSVV